MDLQTKKVAFFLCPWRFCCRIFVFFVAFIGIALEMLIYRFGFSVATRFGYVSEGSKSSGKIYPLWVFCYGSGFSFMPLWLLISLGIIERDRPLVPSIGGTAIHLAEGCLLTKVVKVLSVYLSYSISDGMNGSPEGYTWALLLAWWWAPQGNTDVDEMDEFLSGVWSDTVGK